MPNIQYLDLLPTDMGVDLIAFITKLPNSVGQQRPMAMCSMLSLMSFPHLVFVSVTLHRAQIIVDRMGAFEKIHVIPLLDAVVRWTVRPSPEPKIGFELNVQTDDSEELRVTMQHGVSEHSTVNTLVILPVWPGMVSELREWQDEVRQRHGILVEVDTNRIKETNKTTKRRKCTHCPLMS